MRDRENKNSMKFWNSVKNDIKDLFSRLAEGSYVLLWIEEFFQCRIDCCKIFDDMDYIYGQY